MRVLPARLDAARGSGSGIRGAPEELGQAGLVEAFLGDGDEGVVDF
jgi:hypothetical protein